MKLAKPHVWIAVLSLVGVLCMAVVDTRRTSPGELATVHGRIPELADRDGCSQCHGGWRTSMTEACLECHEAIDGQMERGLGLHGSLPADDAARCAVCHSDHHGIGFGIVNLQSFVQAGFHGGRDGFEHDFVGFPMDGRHLELECSECHVNADARVLDQGAHRFVGLDQGCVSCHDDPHEGRMKLACAQCHGQRSWEELGSRDHDRFLPLVGGHEASGCRDCHARRTPFSLEKIGGLAQRAPPRECTACHEDPHTDAFLGNVADLSATTHGLSCGVCHEAEHESFQDERLVVDARLHACSGFSLGVPHDQTACADCHADSLGDFAARYPGRAADDCAQCHADPHGGQFDHEPWSAKGCVSCHDTRHFEPHDFGPRKHQRTAFALTGTHVDTDCDACHELPPGGGDAPGPRVFNGTPAECAACHEDAHRGFFAWLDLPAPSPRSATEMARAGPRGKRGPTRARDTAALAAVSAAALAARIEAPSDCDACHTTGTFAELPAAGFDHAAWTGFPIAGAHAQSECEICHVAGPEPDALGRSFGFVDEHFGAIERTQVGLGGSCATCHEDPHRGSFDTAARPALVGGHIGCARCHVETSFREFRGRFDHKLWTNVELVGAHGELGCTECHIPNAIPDEFGRTWGEASGRSCSACHDDPHAGQFERAGDTDCNRCHKTTDFTDLRFDHDRNSRFPLDDAHEEVACSACHLPVTAESSSRVVRYRPLPMKCIDCHGSNEGPSPTRRGKGQGRKR